MSDDVPNGLPAALPPGERLLWQGSPDWRVLAVRAFHIRAIGLYFLALALWRFATAYSGGQGLAQASLHALTLALVAVPTLALVGLLAWGTARASVYTVTSKRLVLKTGIALKVSINLPWRMVDSADLRRHGDGSGDIALSVSPDARIAFLMMWPHVRPWRLKNPQPMLRALRSPDRVAEILARALAADAGAPAQVIERPPTASAGADPQPAAA